MFEKEKKYNEIASILYPKGVSARKVRQVMDIMIPGFTEGMFKARPCSRKLEYVGMKNFEDPEDLEDKTSDGSFKLGEIYQSIDYTGATYAIGGYVDSDGDLRRIGRAYFDIVEDDPAMPSEEDP